MGRRDGDGDILALDRLGPLLVPGKQIEPLDRGSQARARFEAGHRLVDEVVGGQVRLIERRPAGSPEVRIVRPLFALSGHSHNDRGDTPYLDQAPDDVVPRPHALPQSVGQHNRNRSRSSEVIRDEEAPSSRRGAQNLEEPAGDIHRLGAHRGSAAGHVELPWLEEGDFVEDPGLLPGHEIRRRDGPGVAPGPPRGLGNDELVRLGKREGPQQYRFNHTEDRGGRSYAETQGQDRDGAEARCAGERAHRDPEIAKPLAQAGKAAGLPGFFLDSSHRAEITPGGAAGVSAGQAVTSMLLGLHVEVKLDFLIEVRFPAPRGNQRADSPPQLTDTHGSPPEALQEGGVVPVDCQQERHGGWGWPGTVNGLPV